MTDDPQPGEPPSDEPLSDIALARLAESRAQRDRPRPLFTSDLSVNEFLLVREAGFRPLGLVLGSSVYHVGVQLRRWTKNQELTTLSQAMYHARELAMRRMEAEADALGADGIVGVRLQIEFKAFGRHLAEFVAIGTAVRADNPPPTGGTWRTNQDLPFTSSLSGQDFWTLVQSGYAPLGMVMGTCVYHVAHRLAAGTVTAYSANAEVHQYTQALYEARELAMARMQHEAQQLDAEGIVGVRLDNFAHLWEGHTTEFFAIGNAVRPLRDDHRITPPTTVLPLTDG